MIDEKEYQELKKWKREHLRDVEYLEKHPVIDITITSIEKELYLASLLKIKEIVYGDYEVLDPLAKKQIENIVRKALNE